MFLLHPQIEPWLVRTESGLRVALLTDRTDLDAVYLRALPDNEERLIQMKRAGRSGALIRYEAVMPWDEGNVQTLYAFKLRHDGTLTWFAADGAHAFMPRETSQFRVGRDVPPPWVRDQIFYQVFPDRFCRGNAPRNRSGEQVFGSRPRPVVQLDWGAPLDPAQASNTFYGGDLDGIASQLDYLQTEVGATALYLNPIFTAGSNHRYDTEDFYSVDPHLGGNAALERLTRALHARGMRLVLDAVVNHTGTNHPWFNRWNRHPTVGAAQSHESPWRGWYVFDRDGEPMGWKGHASLPVLDYSDPDVRAIVYERPDAILRHWLRPPYSIDGWRLDVIHMLGEGAGARNNATYVRAFRRAIKEENRDAYVLGEHFAEATRWLQGDQEDGAMNYYGFLQPVWAWLAGKDIARHPITLDGAQLENWLARARSAISYDHQLAQLNLLDSHDTARLLTLLAGDVARMKLALTLLYTYPGVPCVYYGDEVGMVGGPDPDCRRCFNWDRASWDVDLLAHVRALAHLRTSRVEWRTGAYLSLGAGENWIAYARFTASQATIVCVNRGEGTSFDLPVWRLPLAVPHWKTLGVVARATHDGMLTVNLARESSVLLLGAA
jgi:alpha-glucosidase